MSSIPPTSRKKRSLLLAFGFLSIIIIHSCQCNTQGNEEQIHREMIGALTDSICNCLQPVTEFNVRMQELMNSGRKSEVMLMTEQAGIIQSKAFACSKSNVHKSHLDSIPYGELEIQLRANCYGVTERLQQNILRYLQK